MNSHILRYTVTDIEGNLLFDSADWPRRLSIRHPVRSHKPQLPRRKIENDSGQDGHVIDRPVVLIAAGLVLLSEALALYLVAALIMAVAQ